MIIDLTKLPEAQVIETLSYDAILADNVALLQQIIPDYEPLESDNYMPLLEAFAYRELFLRRKINQSAKAVMLPYATGSDLDNLAAFYNVTRLVVVEEDLTASPVVEQVLEPDDRFKERILLSLNQFSTAGSIDSYRYHALSVSTLIKDVSVLNPSPGHVLVTLLTSQESGLASAELVQDVERYLSDEKVRPLTDQVAVQSAIIVPYEVHATLFYYANTVPELVQQTALDRLTERVASLHDLGNNIHASAIASALHVEGVQRVQLTGFTDLVVSLSEAAFCTRIVLSDGGFDA